MQVLAFFYFDPMYFVFMAPAILLAMWAQWRVKSAYAEASEIPAGSGLSGAETAQRILDEYGISDVAIESVNSFLGDHYDSQKKVLRLSPDVYSGRSLASLGIAAHEVGHAIQDAKAYAPLALRNGLVPMASVGSNLAMILIIAGLVIAMLRPLAIVGLLLWGVVVLFQVINLPVEFNASRRARAVLLSSGMITQVEDRIVAKVLSAAAMTYVAATIVATMQLLYYAMLVLGGQPAQLTSSPIVRPGELSCMETEIRRAMNAIWQVMSCGADPTPEEWREILEMLAPFREHRYLNGAVSREASNRALSLVWAATGDAYRETGDFVTAAEAYRTAGSFRPGSFYADVYAKMVLEHGLSDHYEAALVAFDEGERLHRQARAWLRLYTHILSALNHPIVFVKSWWNLVMRSSRRRELHRRIAELKRS